MNTVTFPEQWRQRVFRAMGSQMAMWLEMEDEDSAEYLLGEAESIFHHNERLLSRFDADSELSYLNNGAGSWTPVTDLMWEVVTKALFMARETDGLFDPTQLKALEAAGYTITFEDIQWAEQVGDVLPGNTRYGQWQAVELDAQRQAIRFPANVKLDLGGIAKGYTAQQVALFLSQWGACLVDAGGDLTAGNAPSGQPGWPVAVAAPLSHQSEERVELFPIWLVDGTMATSGIDYRRWRHNGRSAHHVIDPRTGQPAETDLMTVTVLARTAVRAEAWATASLVAGQTAAFQNLSNKNLAAALVDRQGNLTLTPALSPFLAATINN